MSRLQIFAPLLVLSLMAAAAAFAHPQQKSEAAADVVSASTLTRTHSVNPAWPQSANGVEGWVLLRFTVLPDGAVADIEIRGASPAGLFEESAIEALRQWKFAPVERDGKKIAQRAEIRMNYKLPG